MHLALSLPRVEAIDLRPWVPPEHALVISSEHINSDGSQRGTEAAKNVAWPPPADSPAHLMKPSFLTMEFSASPRLAKQKVGGTEVVLCQQKKTWQDRPLPTHSPFLPTKSFLAFLCFTPPLHHPVPPPVFLHPHPVSPFRPFRPSCPPLAPLAAPPPPAVMAAFTSVSCQHDKAYLVSK